MRGTQQKESIRWRNNGGLSWQQSAGEFVPTDLWADDKIQVEGKETRRVQK